MYASVRAFQGVTPSSLSFDYQIPGRVVSVLGNPNTYAIALCVGLMICVYFIEEHQNKLLRILLIGVSLLFAYQVMFLAGSRKGILTLFLAPGVYILLRHYSIHRKISAGVLIQSSLLIGLVVWGLSAVLQHSEFAYRLSNIGTDISTTNRIAFIQWGVKNFWSRPIFGYGGDQFRAYWPGGNIYSHTNYIELLFNNGLVGILVYYSFFVTLFRGFYIAFQEQRLSARDFRWSMTVIVILLFWDTAMVSYYDKFIWIAYSLLVAVYTMTVDVKPEPVAQEKASYVGRPARYGIPQDH
jgi:O-antigen ligase